MAIHVSSIKFIRKCSKYGLNSFSYYVKLFQHQLPNAMPIFKKKLFWNYNPVPNHGPSLIFSNCNKNKINRQV